MAVNAVSCAGAINRACGSLSRAEHLDFEPAVLPPCIEVQRFALQING
jgi:hypothetical protein